MNCVKVMSGVQSFDVIKFGCDVPYNSYDVIYVVGLISHRFQMCYNQYTASNSSATVEAMTGMLGVMTLIECV